MALQRNVLHPRIGRFERIIRQFPWLSSLLRSTRKIYTSYWLLFLKSKTNGKLIYAFCDITFVDTFSLHVAAKQMLFAAFCSIL